jgi:hypothetical protein
MSLRVQLLVLILPMLIGCTTAVYLPERPRLVCPEPEIVCHPGTFDQVTIDTSSAVNGPGNYHFAISQVNGLNGKGNEFGVVFPQRGRSSVEALATIRSSGRRNLQITTDKMVSVRFRSVTEAIPGNELNAAVISSSLGTGDLRADSLYFTARWPGRLIGDYDMVTATIRGDQFVEPAPVPISSLRFWDAQPALSPDGHLLFFASNRVGGIGGVDIYVSRRQSDGSWSDPQNVGPGVNSTCDELSPWVSGDGRWLYFASSGHNTVGGYDIFRAPIVGDQLAAPENLGRPINTTADELFPSAPSGAQPDTLLYYSSNQSGGVSGFDMYVLHRQRRGRTTTVATRQGEKTTLEGTIRDSKGDPVPDALVKLEEKDPPGRKDSTHTSRQGEYEFDVERGKRYEVTAESDKTLYTRETVTIPASGDKPVSRDITLPDTVTFRVNFPFNNATDPYEYTLDDRGLTTDLTWIQSITRAADFLKQFNSRRDVSFEIVGHTDPIGTDAFNLDLGRRRAEFIRGELLKRGVESRLLGVRSEGESKPLPMGEDEPDDLYRARLRRVELFRR